MTTPAPAQRRNPTQAPAQAPNSNICYTGTSVCPEDSPIRRGTMFDTSTYLYVLLGLMGVQFLALIVGVIFSPETYALRFSGLILFSGVILLQYAPQLYYAYFNPFLYNNEDDQLIKFSPSDKSQIEDHVSTHQWLFRYGIQGVMISGNILVVTNIINQVLKL